MQANMHAFRLIHAQKHLLNLSTRLSCKYSLNPNFPPQFYTTPQRSIHFTNHLNSWTIFDSEPKKDTKVTAIYDPITGSLSTERVSSVYNNGDENNQEVPKISGVGDDGDRAFGVVKKGNLRSGSTSWKSFGAVSGGGKKKGKVKTSWVCESCGYSDGQWWGSCRSCDGVGTMKRFSEGDGSEGKITSGFGVSEKMVQTWLPQQVEDCEESTLQQQSKKTCSNMSILLPSILAHKVFDDYSEKEFSQKVPVSIPRGTNSIIYSPILYWKVLKIDSDRVKVYNLHENEYGKIDSKFFENFKNMVSTIQVFEVCAERVKSLVSFPLAIESIVLPAQSCEKDVKVYTPQQLARFVKIMVYKYHENEYGKGYGKLYSTLVKRINATQVFGELSIKDKVAWVMPLFGLVHKSENDSGLLVLHSVSVLGEDVGYKGSGDEIGVTKRKERSTLLRMMRVEDDDMRKNEENNATEESKNSGYQSCEAQYVLPKINGLDDLSNIVNDRILIIFDPGGYKRNVGCVVIMLKEMNRSSEVGLDGVAKVISACSVVNVREDMGAEVKNWRERFESKKVFPVKEGECSFLNPLCSRSELKMFYAKICNLVWTLKCVEDAMSLVPASEDPIVDGVYIAFAGQDDCERVFNEVGFIAINLLKFVQFPPSIYERNAFSSIVTPICSEQRLSTVGPVPVIHYKRCDKIWNLSRKTQKLMNDDEVMVLEEVTWQMWKKITQNFVYFILEDKDDLKKWGMSRMGQLGQEIHFGL